MLLREPFLSTLKRKQTKSVCCCQSITKTKIHLIYTMACLESIQLEASDICLSGKTCQAKPKQSPRQITDIPVINRVSVSWSELGRCARPLSPLWLLVTPGLVGTLHFKKCVATSLLCKNSLNLTLLVG